MPSPLQIQEHVPLAPFTTLELGGPARYFVRVQSEADLAAALKWAAERKLDTHVLGGGSNVVIADDGLAGLVIHIGLRGLEFSSRDTGVQVLAAAGEPWDALVTEAVRRDLAGIECLAGIPGLVGATPVQNVGAYGQEISEVITAVRVLDRRSRTTLELDPAGCEFGYRSSIFKRDPGRYIVLSVTLTLQLHGTPTVRYAELDRALDGPRTLQHVRSAVVALRRRKSMVLEPTDANRRSAGSFFTNPIVDTTSATRIVQLAMERGMVASPEEMPQFAAGPGMIKIPAGWLIERAGVARGLRRDHVGISTRHALALVHHGGGTTRELLDLAAFVQERVRVSWGVSLTFEPVVLGTV